ALADAVVTGENRAFVGLLAWLNGAACQRLVGADGASLADLARHPVIREHVRAALVKWNAAHPGSSERVARVLLLPDLPAIDANEITDKGYINQRAALETRRREFERLHAGEAGPDVIAIG